LCRGRLNATDFRRELRRHLERLVAFDAYCVNTVDPTSRLITSSIGDGLSGEDARRLFELEERGTDFNSLATLKGPVTIYQATEGCVTRSERMRRVFLPLGLGDELRAPLDLGDTRWGYLHLFRGRGHRPFGAADVANVASVLGEITHSLRRATLLAKAAPSHAVGVVILDRRARPRATSGEARGWALDLGEDVGGSTPHIIVSAGLGAFRRTVLAHHRAPGGVWLSVHGSRLEQRAALVFAPASPRDLRLLLFLAHGLTPREREVAMLILEGHLHASVANQLGIGLHTAKDHAKAVFSKTRTSGRAELAARFA
jgi:DNA-binding CsgD family transcriptional regulator